MLLHVPFQRTGAIDRIEAVVCDEGPGSVGQLQRKLPVSQTLIQFLQ